MRHNVTTLTLLRNKEFELITDNNDRVIFHVPTFEDYITDSYLNIVLSVLELDRTQYEGLPIESHHDMLLFMLSQKMYTEHILFTLHKYIPNLKVELKGFFVQDKIITKKEFDVIIDAWRLSIGVLDYEDWEMSNEKDKEEELDDVDRLIKEREAKVRRIKNKKQTQDGQGNLNLEKIIITVIKEFGFKMEELFSMNLFTIFWYYRYALKYNNYRIETIAFGNGLIKKMQHFSD